MKHINLNSLQDYLALLVRRKWWVIVPFFALSGAVVVLTSVLPKLFVSETLILIRPGAVPPEFVKDPMANTIDQRLTAIQQTVLSRTILIQILREFEDELTEYRKLNMDEKVVKLTNQIKIIFQAEKRGAQDQVTYFRISYQNRNPELAQKIAAKLTSLFIAQDQRTQTDQYFGTTDFLTNELNKVEEQMKDSGAKLKELRARRRYELPDQLETNLRTLDRLGLQKQSNADALDRYATIRLNLERLLTETQSVLPQPPIGAVGSASMNPSIDEYRKKLREVKALTVAGLKPTHPDLVAALSQLDRLKKDLSPEELAAIELPVERPPAAAGLPSPAVRTAVPTVPNPVYQNLTSQLQEVKTEFENRERERTWIDGEIQKYSHWVQNSPQSEQDIAEILRLNTDLTKQYDSLKNSLTQAELSKSMVSRQQGSQLVIVDPANLPLVPTKPAKSMIALAGTLFSLAAGLAFAFVADLANQKMWTQSDVEHLLGATVLIEIPQILTDSDIAPARRKKLTLLASSVAVTAAYSAVLFLVYVYQSPIIQRLDPILQRFY